MRTPQYREVILDVLKKGHLFTLADLQEKIPEANHSTLFRNLEQLTSEGVVQKVTIKKNVVAYEINKEHGHFICEKCDDVSELAIPALSLEQGCTVNGLTAHGVCASCK